MANILKRDSGIGWIKIGQRVTAKGVPRRFARLFVGVPESVAPTIPWQVNEITVAS
jgi:hypothetical protein